MKHDIDYNRVWDAAIAMLRAHQEAVLALAGVLVFLPSWIAQFFGGSPDLVGVTSMTQILERQQTHLAANWHILLPTAIFSLFGSACIYVVMTRNDLAKVGDALPIALKLLPLYFVFQVATGMLLAGSVFVLVIPVLYVLVRFWLAMAALPDGQNLGLFGALSRSWNLTKGVGWKAVGLAVIVGIVSIACFIVVQIIVGLLMQLFAGKGGVPFVEMGSSALVGTIINIVVIALTVALYRQLCAQEH